MIEEWLRPVERVMLASEVRNARVIGFIAPEAGAGVSTLCRMAAELAGRSGSRTLLVDLSAPVVADDGGTMWSEASPTLFGFDTAVSTAGKANALRFNRSEWFREVLTGQFAGYDRIIVDLPPLLSPPPDGINPTAAAAACDAVIMLVTRGASSPPDLETGVELLRSAGANFVGTVLNEFNGRRRAA